MLPTLQLGAADLPVLGISESDYAVDFIVVALDSLVELLGGEIHDVGLFARLGVLCSRGVGDVRAVRPNEAVVVTLLGLKIDGEDFNRAIGTDTCSGSHLVRG